MSEMVNTVAASEETADAPLAASGDDSEAATTMEHLLSAFKGMGKKKKTKEVVDHENHKFWGKQPVPQFMDDVRVDANEPIDEPKTVADIRQEPYNMPAGFTWESMDILNPDVLNEVYTLLWENYVEDDDNMFRFDYSRDFLLWALTPPGYIKDWHIGVRNTKNGKLMGFITGIPADLKVNSRLIHLTEINFLCVHKSLRDKRLAPVLIKEITRRVNLTDRWQAVYTAGVLLPRPVAKCRYWHRNLNPKKLIEIKFTRLHPRMTMSRTLKLYKLPDHPASHLRPMTPADIPSAHALLMGYLERTTKLHPVLSVEEFAHQMLPRPGVIESYVREVTDMCSFYHLPSTVIGNDKHNDLRAAYSYYNVATTMPLEALMRDCLVLARNSGADVFNALDLMENQTFLNSLKFGIGDGNLQYYLYNWRCADMAAEDIGLVLL